MSAVLENLGLQLWPFIWQLVAFLILVYVLKRFAFGPVTRILDERAARVRESIETAERIQREAAEQEQRTKQMLEDARRQAQAILQQAQQAAERIQSTAQDNAREQANQIIQRAQEDIDRMKAEAIDELRRQVADLAIAAASRIIRKELDPATHRALINEVLAESVDQFRGGRPVA
ncbi:ATP synthase F0, B subunit [Thermobaculum terrenum ATCC BAA-798]|uniref:ATP synthase subunit b n=1 Tax=Thermobaculum terrenum (strain ATCC BAA-798 / CCMEE 7001 / YNP1) TaxID=525904 RepID=D1CDI4_THET1|nr:F0F1 ATP synthase subunit B [Thermobaculum terrenum]ACZ40990.1 ATP synthase F0, B subunit [Thermobaculum terrenum ATCC BAA-798]